MGGKQILQRPKHGHRFRRQASRPCEFACASDGHRFRRQASRPSRCAGAHPGKPSLLTCAGSGPAGSRCCKTAFRVGAFVQDNCAALHKHKQSSGARCLHAHLRAHTGTGRTHTSCTCARMHDRHIAQGALAYPCTSNPVVPGACTHTCARTQAPDAHTHHARARACMTGISHKEH